MMQFILFWIKLFFRVSSVIAPGLAAKKAIKLFQEPHRKKTREREKDIYNNFDCVRIPSEEEDIYSYVSGDSDGHPVVLVHGWESSPGSMCGVARRLVENGYRVIVMGLPAHGQSKLKSTNMIFSARSILELLDHFDLKKDFSMIGHSFGSGAITTALSGKDIQVEKLIFLTTPDRIMDIFKEYKQMIKIGEKAFSKMVLMIEKLAPFNMVDFNISDFLQKVKYKKLLLIHDQNDKILPFANALALEGKNPDIDLHATLGKGHYRLLWDDEVIDLIEHYLKN